MNATEIQPQTQSRTLRRFRTETTLLELVAAVSEVVRTEAELVATVLDLLESGRARLTGNFRDIPIDLFRTRLPKHLRERGVWEEDFEIEPFVEGGARVFRRLHTPGFEGWTISRYRQTSGRTPELTISVQRNPKVRVRNRRPSVEIEQRMAGAGDCLRNGATVQNPENQAVNLDRSHRAQA